MKKMLQSAKEAAKVIKDTADQARRKVKDAQTVETDMGVFHINGGIKKKGKVLKIKVEWEKDFIDDNVTLRLNTGVGELNLISPQKSDKFHCTLTATKRF